MLRENRNARKLLDSGKLLRIHNKTKLAEIRESRLRSFGAPGSLSSARSDVPLTARSSSDSAVMRDTPRAAPLPQYAHQHHFGWTAAYMPSDASASAARRDGFALRTLSQIESVRQGIQARPYTVRDSAAGGGGRGGDLSARRCADKVTCSLSMT